MVSDLALSIDCMELGKIIYSQVNWNSFFLSVLIIFLVSCVAWFYLFVCGCGGEAVGPLKFSCSSPGAGKLSSSATYWENGSRMVHVVSATVSCMVAV